MLPCRFVDSSSGGGTGSGSGGGTKCETGFLQLDPSELRKKPSVEFGDPASNDRPMPDLEDLRVSVVYAAAEAEDAWLLNATLPTVVENFPAALEVVVVVRDDKAAGVYQKVLRNYENSAPFDLRVVVAVDTESSAFAGDDKALFPLVWSEMYCTGRFVLHLDPDSVLIKEMTYDDIFHFGKPVVAFTRFSDEGETRTCEEEGGGEGEADAEGEREIVGCGLVRTSQRMCV